jgi:hypothetical protein
MLEKIVFQEGGRKRDLTGLIQFHGSWKTRQARLCGYAPEQAGPGKAALHPGGAAVHPRRRGRIGNPVSDSKVWIRFLATGTID